MFYNTIGSFTPEQYFIILLCIYFTELIVLKTSIHQIDWIFQVQFWIRFDKGLIWITVLKLLFALFAIYIFSFRFRFFERQKIT